MEFVTKKLPDGKARKYLKPIEIDGMDFCKEISDEELEKCKTIPFYGTCERKSDDGKILRTLTSFEKRELEKRDEIAIYRRTMILSNLSIIISILSIIINLL